MKKKRESYNIQYSGSGSVFLPDLPDNFKLDGVAYGRPAAVDPQICSSWRSAYVKLGFAFHPVDGLCAKSPDTLDGEDGHIPQAL